MNAWKRLSKPDRDYQSLEEIIKAWKRLSKPNRDYQSLEEIFRAWQRLSKPDSDYECLKEIIDYQGLTKIIKACKRLSESAGDYQSLQQITRARKILLEAERDCESLKEIARAWKRLPEPEIDCRSLRKIWKVCKRETWQGVLRLVQPYSGFYSCTVQHSLGEDRSQRVLNDLQRTSLSCGRMIRLLALPFPPLLVSKLSLILSLPVCHRSRLLTGEEGEGEGEEPNHTTVKYPGPLYKSINTLLP